MISESVFLFQDDFRLEDVSQKAGEVSGPHDMMERGRMGTKRLLTMPLHPMA